MKELVPGIHPNQGVVPDIHKPLYVTRFTISAIMKPVYDNTQCTLIGCKRVAANLARMADIQRSLLVFTPGELGLTIEIKELFGNRGVNKLITTHYNFPCCIKVNS